MKHYIIIQVNTVIYKQFNFIIPPTLRKHTDMVPRLLKISGLLLHVYGIVVARDVGQAMPTLC